MANITIQTLGKVLKARSRVQAAILSRFMKGEARAFPAQP